MAFSAFLGSGGGGRSRDSNGYEHGSEAGVTRDDATGSGIPGFAIPPGLFAHACANDSVGGNVLEGARDDHSQGDRGDLLEVRACQWGRGYAYARRRSRISWRRRVVKEKTNEW